MADVRYSVTLKSKPVAEGIRWMVYIRPKPPTGKALIPIPGLTKPSDRPAAEAIADNYRKALRAGLTAPKPETADEWYERFATSREGKVSTVSQDRAQWKKHVSPILGKVAMRAVDADHVEAVRDYLNGQIDAWEEAGRARGTGIAFATAGNVWSILTTAMKHASTRKGERSFRVREADGNPCEGMPPPRRGRAKRRHWCRSAWLDAALACPDNDAGLKEAVAIGVGLHLRPGEQRELRVRDLDLAAGEVRVHRAYDETEKRVKDTKTEEGVRTVSIPAWLLPTLKRIAETRGPNELLSPWLSRVSQGDRAEAFRAFVRRGGAAPSFIFEDTETHERLDFRSVRDTGITLRFLAGDRAEVIQREAGHRHMATTLAYAKEVSNKGDRYGSPFLAVEVAAGSEPVCPVPCEPPVTEEDNSSDSLGKLAPTVGLEPTTRRLTAACSTN